MGSQENLDKIKDELNSKLDEQIHKARLIDREARKSIRHEGLKNLKRRYYLNVIIAFIVAVIVNGGYHFATSGLQPGDAQLGNLSVIEKEQDAIKEKRDFVMNHAGSISNAEITMDFLSELFDFNNVLTTEGKDTSNVFYAGVASVFVNEITGSQSFIFGVLNGLNQLIFKGKIANSVIIFIFSFFSILIFIFVKNVIIIGKIRYYLEQRRYADTGPGELLFPYKNKRLKRLSWVMLCKYIFQVLWDLTIVGGVIKYYEYYLIPYVIAENPSISRKDAFRISKFLMNGEKWDTFVLELSLLPLEILNILTFNLSAIFFTDPYVECVRAELYMKIREKKRDYLELKLREQLNDSMLAIDHVESGEHPSGVEVLDIPTASITKLKYDYKRKYSLQSLIQLFFTYALVGYLWEVIYYVVDIGKLVNRGTMYGPWLPIYGVGGVLIMVLLRPLREKPGLLFLGAVGVCGLVEYIGAWALETFLHQKWWDYSGYFLNIQGRVCFEGLLIFGLAGIAFTYVFSPMLDDFYNRFSLKPRKIVCGILIAIFLVDLAFSIVHPNSGEGITMAEADVVMINDANTYQCVDYNV